MSIDLTCEILCFYYIYSKLSDITKMMKYKSVKHIAKNMADHSTSKDTQTITNTTP